MTIEPPTAPMSLPPTTRLRKSSASARDKLSATDWAPAVLGVGGAAIFIALLAFADFVISQHREGYMEAGVAYDVANGGAITGQAAVALGLATLAVLLRQGRPDRHLLVGAAIVAGLAVGFVLLPTLVAGYSWLTVLLTLLTTLMCNALFGALVVAVALLAPPWPS